MARRGLLVLLSVALAGCRFDASGVPGPDASPFDRALETKQFPDAPPPDHGTDLNVIPFPDVGGDLGCPTQYRCNAKKSQICLAGAYVDRNDCVKGCNAANGACNSFAASNEATVLMHRGTAKLEIADDKSVAVNTDTCTLTATGFTLPGGILTAAPTTARCVIVLGELQIHAKGTLTASGKRALLIAAYGPVKIQGLIDVGARGNTAGPGGGVGGKPGTKPVNSSSPNPSPGEGAGCGGGYPGYAIYDGALLTGIAGASGGTNGGLGGPAGGIGSSGGPLAKQTTPCEPPTPPPPGSSCAAMLFSGSGGGAGGCTLFGGCASGGGGGGGLQISSLHSIVVSGRINAGGGGGGGGGSAGASGGGGGSGGAVLLESWQVTIAGLVAAGGGGGGSGSVTWEPGKNGQDATAETTRAAGGESTVIDRYLIPDLVSGKGGSGSGDLDGSGTAGARSASLAEYAGGGGGGAGRICVRVENSAVGDAKKGGYAPPFSESAGWPTRIETF